MSYEDAHKERYRLSLEWIAPLADKAEKILDIGGESPFTRLVHKRWPGKLTPYYGGDLRQGFVVSECDLILAMEVLEHIEDSSHDDVHTEWRGTGTQMMLASCFVSLRPGGHLFLTTPNPCSITAIHHALNLTPPMLYRPHVREYSPYELDEMVRAVGFEIINRETLDVWRNAISDKAHKAISKFILAENYPPELRGECTFLLAKRPGESKTAS